jgi:tetratricopeptide (TPR) repeat protein
MIPLESRVKELFEGHFCLIVEPSASFSSVIMGVLKSLGISPEQVIMAHKFEAAELIITEKKPKLLITEYDINGKLGLSLIETQSEHFDSMSRISIIITSNTNDSAVAEAAEEEVDAFIVKPFSGQTFTEKITKVFMAKLEPSNYIQAIELGKEHYFAKEFAAAASAFTEAKNLDPKPTLACFYLGQTFQKQGNISKALEAFKEGRSYQPLHYKCLIGEFEGLMFEKKYEVAYELVPILRANYPITSHRLGQIFTAAVFTQHFEDLPLYYKLYLTIEKRSAALIELSSLALLTAGRYFLVKKDITNAVSAFDMGVMVTSKNILFLEKIVLDLLKCGYPKEAQVFMTKILPSDVGTVEFNRLNYRVDSVLLSPDQLIEKGRKLVQDGNATPDIFESLVLQLAKTNRKQLAEATILSAVAIYPDMRSSLYGILETNLPKE